MSEKCAPNDLPANMIPVCENLDRRKATLLLEKRNRDLRLILGPVPGVKVILEIACNNSNP